MSTYIKSYKYLNDENIRFELDTGEIFNYRYRKYNRETIHYLSNKEGMNSRLFTELGISDPYKWAEDVLGYRLCNGGWPEAKSQDDLLKLIDALCKYNNPESTSIKKDFTVEDYPVLPSEVLSFYNEDKTKVKFYSLNVTYEIYILKDRIWWKPTECAIKENFIFESLKIKDKNKWVESIQSYKPSAGTDEIAFPESKTVEDAYKVMDALIAEYIKQFQPKTTIKTNNYGDSKIELRRKKADVRVGSCPAGSIVYGKRSKASVRSRRVSYQTCIGN
jgi:hypothetical protein